MKEKCIEIGTPYLKEISNDRVRLCADIAYEEKKTTLYFETEIIYRDYLCFEVSDAFVLGLLYFACGNGYNIKCCAPTSERLLYQINQYFLPTLHKVMGEQYRMIHIISNSSHIHFDNNFAVGTSASGGVDSFYSVLSHLNSGYSNYKLTHVLVANLFNKYDDENSIRDKFDILVKQSKEITEQLQIPLITMYTNHHEFLFPNYVELYSMRICSYAMALQKLFKVYLLSSGTMFQDTTFISSDSSDYDLFNTQIASNDNLIFYMSGGEKGRVEKINYIYNDETVKSKLHVCTLREESNCSECDKCMRTLTAIDMMGGLSEYKSTFNIEKYLKRKNKYWGKVISQAKDIVYGPLNTELIEAAYKYHYHVSYKAHIWAYFVWNPYFIIKKILKKSKMIKKLYFNLKIDYLLYGKEKAEIYRYGRIAEIEDK